MRIKFKTPIFLSAFAGLVILGLTSVAFADIRGTNGINFDPDNDSVIEAAFTASGNFGLGTATPSANLHVAGGGNTHLEGPLTYSGAGKPNRTIVLTAAGAVVPSADGAAQTLVDGTYHSFYVLEFDKDTDESAYWHWIQQDSYDGGNIDVTVYWYSETTGGDVVWSGNTLGIGAGEAVDGSLGTAQAVTDPVAASANILSAASFTAFSPGWAAGDYVVFRIFRDADNGADTHAADARFIKAKIEYAANAESD